MKMTSDGRRPQNIKSGISHQISNLSLVDPTKIKFGLKSETKATSNGPPIGKRPQNIKSGISQQPLIGSSSNFKLKLMGPNQNKMLLENKRTSDGR
jgi:hypothetical protein